MKREPLFITFEGGEGSGKSTQVKEFSEWYKKNYGLVQITREPGGVLVSEKIREILLNPEYELQDLTELLLFESARQEFVNNVVAPTIESGESLISDRFYDSTTAYQGFARGGDLQLIQQLNSLAVTSNGKQYHPDLTILIDIDPGKGISNARERGTLHRIDAEMKNFHERVRDGFLNISKANPKRVVVIPYQDGIEKVQTDIQKEFSKRYK